MRAQDKTGVKTRLDQIQANKQHLRVETVNSHDAKTRFSQLMDKVAAGEDVVISRHDKLPVRLNQLAESTRRVRFGVLRGKVKVADDFDARLPDHVLAEFEGG